MNEDIYLKSIEKALTMPEDLQMIEAVGNYTGNKTGATFYRGTKAIDGVWVTSHVVIIGACVMPAHYGIGYHRLFFVGLSNVVLDRA